MTPRDHHSGDSSTTETDSPEPSCDPAPNAEQDDRRISEATRATARLPRRLATAAAAVARVTPAFHAVIGAGRIPPKMRSAQVVTTVTAVAALGAVLGQTQPHTADVDAAAHPAPLSTQAVPLPPPAVPEWPPSYGIAGLDPDTPDDRVEGWIDQATGILEKHGVSEEAVDEDDVRTIIEHESGGDPAAINNWDSNASRGTPSKGIMQTIDPTFESYALPGHQNIWHPVDNIIAASLYSIDRYGSVSNVPGVVGQESGGAYEGY